MAYEKSEKAGEMIKRTELVQVIRLDDVKEQIEHINLEIENLNRRKIELDSILTEADKLGVKKNGKVI